MQPRQILGASTAVLLLLWATLLVGQPVENQSVLTIEQIMEGERFVGFSPTNVVWSEDSKMIYFDWNPNQEILRSRYQISVSDKKAEKVALETLRQMPASGGAFNRNFTKKVYSKNGDIFLLDIASGKKIQITNTLDFEFNPSFSGDESKISFTQGGNLFTWTIATGQLEQISDFRKGEKREKSKLKPHEAWLEKDQLAHFQILKERKEKRELEQQWGDTLKPKRPLEIYYGSKQLSNLQASPDLNFITFRWTTEASEKGTEVPQFVTESGYTNDLKAREKVGTPQDSYEFGVYDRLRDTFYLLDIKQLDGILDKPAYFQMYHNDTTPYRPTFDKPRSVIIHDPVYSDDGKAVLDVRALDNKDRWLVLLDLKTGKLQTLDRQHDDAWIGGPGIGEWDYYPGNMGWVSNDEFFFQSEKTGFSHLYIFNLKTGSSKALTEGQFEILDANLSKDKKYFWVTSNRETPHQHHFYRLPTSGGAMEKITNLDGGNEVVISPDEKWLAIRHSQSNQPWELYLMKNQVGAKAEKLTTSTTPAFQAYDWRKPPIVRFTASDGVQVPARLYRPDKPNGAAVIFVHGAGYLQNVHEWWSSYYREFMFHNLLTDNGYTVLDIDYRASEGYGRDWRTAIYRFMGGRDLDDQIDGAKFLVEQYGVDANRIGIYGGSYGGFITLMAMLTKSGVFKSGAALRSVTDWAHYNHPYTNNILNTPLTDSVAYRQSSPIYHAEGFNQGNLLILHGMVDTNVQFQDVVRLAQRFIELGKDNWEFAVFPVEDHGFVEPSSWSDEYKRIFKLFQTTLK